MINSIELNLLHALQWESHDFDVANHRERWDLSEDEAEAVKKWIDARIKEIKEKI
jgi:hypothetical protein